MFMLFYSCFISYLLFATSLTIKCLVQYFENKITCFQYFTRFPGYIAHCCYLYFISFHHKTGCAISLIKSPLVVSLIN